TKQDHENNGTCTVTDDPNPESLQISGTASGTTITGAVLDGRKQQPFTMSVSGNTINGMVSGEFAGESTTFSATRSSTGVPAPAITGFTATPSTITAGESATLYWGSLNASSVSIDNGVGSRPASGSVTVSPSLTTAYKLTASGPGGNSAASVTVMVAPP